MQTQLRNEMYKTKDHLRELKMKKIQAQDEEAQQLIQNQIAVEDILAQYKTVEYESVELLSNYLNKHYQLILDLELCDMQIDLLRPIRNFIDHMKIDITDEDNDKLLKSIYTVSSSYSNVYIIYNAYILFVYRIGI